MDYLRQYIIESVNNGNLKPIMSVREHVRFISNIAFGVGESSGIDQVIKFRGGTLYMNLHANYDGKEAKWVCWIVTDKVDVLDFPSSQLTN